MSAKVKNILPKSSRSDNYRRWIGFSEDDANFTAEGADIRLRRRPGKLRTNAFSVKLRGSHAPLRRTTRSTTCLAPRYGRGKGVGRGLGGGLSLGIGVGRGVAVGVVLAVAVGVAVAVAVGVGVTVAVAVAVGVGVGEPPLPEGPWIATVVGDPVLK